MYEVDQYTIALLHFDDGLKDETGKVWTSNDEAMTRTAQSKFGESSLYLNNQSIQTANESAFHLGTGDFTIDAWVYFSGNDVCLFASGIPGSGSRQGGYAVGVNSNGAVTFSAHTTGTWCSNTTYNAISSKNAMVPLNKWTHIAAVRANGLGYLFINGILQEIASSYSGSNSFAGIVAAATNDSLVYIGYVYDTFNGDRSRYLSKNVYIDEFRISKGIARWTSDFNPKAPTNLIAAAGDSQVSLSWTAVAGATGYNVKRSTTAGGPYTAIATKVTGTIYVDKNVTNGITYHYVVTAIDGSENESANSNEASATLQASNDNDNALLRVTMVDSSEREYRLLVSEADGFIDWYNHHKSTDTMSYSIRDVVDQGKEYLAFDKIISFKVIPFKS